MKKIILGLLFISATNMMASAQNNSEQKKTTVNANVSGKKVSASKTTEKTDQTNGQSGTQTKETNQTSASKRTTTTTNNGGVHTNAGKHKGTYKKRTSSKGSNAGNVKHTTKTTTTTSASQQ